MSSRPDCIFEIHQLWQSGFSRVHSNSCSSCSFEPEIIKIDQSSHNMYRNNMLNFQESTTILNASTKSLETYWIIHVCCPLNWCCLHFDKPLNRKCQAVQTVFFRISKGLCATRSKTPLIGCLSLARLSILCLCLNLPAWFSSRGVILVTHQFDLPASKPATPHRLLITT